jgi:primosomal protein N' (replication factor Y)
MVAKGLNFPGVRLVGIILADSSLNLPDFRAGERTFALIVQVSGRAGRFLDDGKVVVQTFKPEAPAIKLAVQGDLPAYYEGELSERRELLFPPYYRLFRIVVRGRDRGKVRTVIRDIARDLSFLKHNGAEILGPSECPLETIAKNHRYQLLIRSRFFNRTHRDLRGWFLSYERPSSVFLEIDVDPVSLL